MLILDIIFQNKISNLSFVFDWTLYNDVPRTS